MKIMGIIVFVIGLYGMTNINGLAFGVGIIAFACLLGIVALMFMLHNRRRLIINSVVPGFVNLS